MELKIHHLRTENKLKVTLSYAIGREEALTLQYLISFLQVHGSAPEELTAIKTLLTKGIENDAPQRPYS